MIRESLIKTRIQNLESATPPPLPTDDGVVWVRDPAGRFVGDFASRQFERWVTLDLLDPARKTAVAAAGWERFRVERG